MTDYKEDISEDDDLFSDLMDKYALCEEFYSEIFSKGEEDKEFTYGINQWDAAARKNRADNGKPMLTFNQMLPYARRVVNDGRESRPAIRVSPVDDKADIDTAEIFSGLIRNIEYQSSANIAYDTALLNAVTACIGWIRVNVDYANEMSFDQEVSIGRVLNFQSVMLDPTSTALDGSDSEYGFIIDDYSKGDFESRWPDADVSSFQGYSEGWCSENTVRVAECYYKEYEEKDIYLVRYEDMGISVDGVVFKDEIDLLKENGVTVEIVDQRKTQIVKIKQCLMSGKEILSKTDWLGKYIPLVPVVGEEVFLNGRREMHSLIRQGKDAQRMYNYIKTSAAEIYGLQPRNPVVGAVGSFDSYPERWANANTENYAYLEYDIVHDQHGQRVEPPRREPMIMGSPQLMQEGEIARADIRLAIGMPEASMGEDGAEISGVALRSRQMRGDQATFHIMDNLAISIAQVGRILVDLIPKIYRKPQIARILGKDSTQELVPINQPYVKEENGVKRPVKRGEEGDGIYRLDAGKYDVTCDVGASYLSQRQEMADKLTEISRAWPELLQIAGDMVIASLDLPNAQEIAERIRANMNPALLGDDPQAARLQEAAATVQQLQEQLANMDAALKDKQKDTQFEQQYRVQELELDRQKAMVDAQKTQADIAKIQYEINSGIAQSAAGMQGIAAVIDELRAQVADVTEAFGMMVDFEDQNLANGELEQSPASAMESVNV